MYIYIHIYMYIYIYIHIYMYIYMTYVREEIESMSVVSNLGSPKSCFSNIVYRLYRC